MQGTSLTSAWSATGLVVSGVAEARMRSTLSPRISSEATSEARLPRDWLSLLVISAGEGWAPPGAQSARLAVLADELDRIGLAPDRDALREDAAHLLEDEGVGFPEAGERTG